MQATDIRRGPVGIDQAAHDLSEHEEQMRTAEHLHRKMQFIQHQRVAVQASGLPALKRLVAAAQRSSGQSAVVGRFLLGLFNGKAYNFNLTDLRFLDQELHSDCMAVLMMDWSHEREVHEMVEGGHHIFQGLIARWA